MAYLSGNVFSDRMRLLVWLNISLQLIFPLAVSFTPAIAGNATSEHFLSAPAGQAPLRTRVYTLLPGETVASVARHYNMTPAALRSLNQLRTFAHGFDHLQAGDELDVPLAPLPSVTWDAGGVSGQGRQDDPQAQKLAGVASQVGGVLASRAGGEAATAMARGMATGAAGNQLQQWLGRFGTARVQLDAGKNLSLKNSQFDLLVPLYDGGENMLFTQGSLHRTDERTQSNLGVGLRHFTPTYMAGGNLFWDYDLSRRHARMGVGVEYWRDNLKLGANTYQRLTGWRDSPDLTDYEARPANGWDIRAQAWVPSLPQLGGKLTYEQYYGDEVALFSPDKRQHNPHAITAGVSYTPVPLVTFSVEQRQGQSGQNDTRLGVELNYQPGVAWQRQVSPDAVAAMRSLAGSRYDLVERNNNIVLEYRKKEVISLYTVGLLTGYAGEQKSLGVSVNSKYGLASVEWSAVSLQAAGGRIVQAGAGGYSVVLPAWQAGVEGVNSYTVSGVAVDTKGNRSARRDTQVTVQAPVVNVQNSTFSPARSTLSADGKSTQVLTLSVRDGQGQAVDVAAGDVTLSSGALKSATVSAAVRQSAGIYAVTVTAGRDAETVTVSPVVGGVKLSGAVVTVVAATPVEANSGIAVDNTTYIAGSDMRVTVTLKDAGGNPVTGVAASLTPGAVTVPDATLKSGSWTDNNDGTYTAIYTATTAGTNLKATLKLSGWGGTVTSAAYAITAVAPDALKSTAKAAPDTIVADGRAHTTLTLSVNDADGHPVSGLNTGHITWKVSPADGIAIPGGSIVIAATQAGGVAGTYTATLTGTHAGKITVMPQLDGKDVAATAAMVTLTTLPPDVTKSTVSASPDTILADDYGSTQLKLEVRDADNHPLAGPDIQNITWKVTSADGGTISPGSIKVGPTTAGSKGIYYTSLKGSYKGKVQVMPQFNGHDVVAVPAFVVLAPSTKITILKRGAFADGTETNEIQVTQAPNTEVELSILIGDPKYVKLSSYKTSTGNSGVVNITATATKPGKYMVDASGFLHGYDKQYMDFVAIPDKSHSSVLASPDHIEADNSTLSTLTLALNGSDGSPIDKNISSEITWSSLPADGVIISKTTQVGKGRFTATLKGNKPNNLLVTPLWRGNPIVNTPAAVTLTPSTRALIPHVSIVKDNALADGTEINTVQIEVTDNKAQQAGGIPVTVKANNGAIVSEEHPVTGEHGSVKVTVTNKHFGPVIVTATLNGGAHDEKTINFKPFSGKIVALSANGHDFDIKDQFPKTGFSGANFKIKLAGASPQDYQWKTSSFNVSVDENGLVTLGGGITGKTLTVTGTPKSGGEDVSYSFKVERFYENHSYSGKKRYSTAAVCQLPSSAELSAGESIRGVGSLYGEWGNMTHYSGWDDGFYWTGDFVKFDAFKGQNIFRNVRLTDGWNTGNSWQDDELYVVCRST